MKKLNTKVAMIGCGKLGQDCAEVMAEKYFVEGYDIEPRQPENFKMQHATLPFASLFQTICK